MIRKTSFLIILLALALNACKKEDELSLVEVVVNPSSVECIIGAELQFSSTINGSDDQEVVWKIREESEGGSITQNGLFKAPNKEGTFHVVATSAANPNSSTEATVLVSLPPTNAEKASAIQLYNDLFLGSMIADNNWNGNTTQCNTGNTSQANKEKVLKRIHYYRRMTGLNNQITENPEKSSKCEEAALMCLANNKLDHSPPDTWKCFTQDGKEACGKSNLAFGSISSNAVTAYMQDADNYFVGHRRWLLFPKLKEIGTGDTDKTNVLWVIGNNGPTPDDMPDFVAWPPKGYVPSTVIYPRWSFSIPGADFSETEIEILDPEGKTVPIQMEKLNNAGYGDRTIVWAPQNITLNSNEDLNYKVLVKSVKTGGEVKDFEYTVTIFKP